jgi:hypothetical protein
VPIPKVEEWVKANKSIPYIETSALEGSNVEVAFNRIASSLLKLALANETSNM